MCLADLSHFLSRFVERVLPFFKMFCGEEPSRWTEECQKVFDELKQYLARFPSLVSSKHGAKLLLYLVASIVVVIVVLVQEDNGVKHPIYYVSEALQEAKAQYTKLEKLAYAMLLASCKLCHYFMAHEIAIPSSPQHATAQQRSYGLNKQVGCGVGSL